MTICFFGTGPFKTDPGRRESSVYEINIKIEKLNEYICNYIKYYRHIG